MKKGICLFGIVISSLLVGCGQNSSLSNVSSSTFDSIDDSSSTITNVYNVTFVNYDKSTNVVNVNEGDVINNPGEDKTIEGERVKFYGWYLNDEPYDFSLPITSNLTLVSHCVSYDDIDTEIRWVFTNNIETSDVIVERDVTLLALNNNEYFGFIKNKEAINHFKYGDKYVVSTPFKELKTATFSNAYNVYENDELIATVKDGDEIEVDGNYTIIVNTNPITISSSIDGVDKGSIDITSDYVIPSYDSSKLEENQKFIGYKLDNDYRLYQPGEILISDELQDFDSLDFVSTIIDTSSSYHISSVDDWNNLLSEDLTDEGIVISFDADLDFNNEDLGPGIEEFNGTILGNNHTISNASIDKNDEDGGYCGFIQYTQYGCNVFN